MAFRYCVAECWVVLWYGFLKSNKERCEELQGVDDGRWLL